MNQTPEINLTTLEVCPNEKVGDISVTTKTSSGNLCQYCGVKPAKKKFCSTKCRMTRHRSNLRIVRICLHCKINPAKQFFCSKICRADYQTALRLARRNLWVTAKIRDKSFSFDGRFGGHDLKSVPPLGSFEKLSLENHFVELLRQAFELPSLFQTGGKHVL